MKPSQILITATLLAAFTSGNLVIQSCTSNSDCSVSGCNCYAIEDPAKYTGNYCANTDIWNSEIENECPTCSTEYSRYCTFSNDRCMLELTRPICHSCAQIESTNAVEACAVEIEAQPSSSPSPGGGSPPGDSGGGSTPGDNGGGSSPGDNGEGSSPGGNTGGNSRSKDCFPGDALVTLESGAYKKMIDLQIGDVVKVGNNKFSEVYTFTHKDSAITAKFVQLTTDNGNVLELSHAHYLYVNGEENIMPAHLVKIGDNLVGENGQELTVTKKLDIEKKGLFNPHTVDGNILVNGVRATSYTEAVQVSAAHSLLSPIRALFISTGRYTSILDNISDYRGQLI